MATCTPAVPAGDHVKFSEDVLLGFSAACSGPVQDFSPHSEHFKSFLSLTGTPAPAGAEKLEYASIAVEVPRDLTAAKAAELHSALAALPKPVWIQCATGNRASAALLLHLALANKWSAAQALAHGAAHGFKCVGAQPMRDWITAALDPLPLAALTAASPSGSAVSSGLVFRQLFEPVSSTYTYLLGCAETRQAVLIDGVLEKADRDAALATALGLTVLYSINTHVHADHVSSSTALKKKLPGLQSMVGEPAAKSDLYIQEGDRVQFGRRSLKVLSTPGHTNGCLSFVLDDDSMVFTGDALLINGAGRCDFQQGSAETLYDSIHGKLFSLPESCLVYPGHNYDGQLLSTIAQEKRFNPRLSKGKEEFVRIMNSLGLPRPKQIDVAVPANMLDGVVVEAPAPEGAAAAAAGGAGAPAAAAAAPAAGKA